MNKMKYIKKNGWIAKKDESLGISLQYDTMLSISKKKSWSNEYESIQVNLNDLKELIKELDNR